MEKQPITLKEYQSPIQPTWCNGCGDFTIWSALKLALVELQLAPHEVLLCFDIGCNGNMSDKLRGYRLHGLHGRVLPMAIGAKIANPELIVIAIGGDGGTYSEGMNHFIHSLRADVPITFICHDNGNYGLTKGQASSTTHQGIAMDSNPDGNPGKTLNPLELALSVRPAFMGQEFSGHLQPMKELLKAAIQHQQSNKGMSFVSMLQSCPTYNKSTPDAWYEENSLPVPEEHDPSNFMHALAAVQQANKKIPMGVIYTNPQALSYFDRLPHRTPHRSMVAEVEQPRTIENLMQEFR